jgi:hypothetical protein
VVLESLGISHIFPDQLKDDFQPSLSTADLAVQNGSFGSLENDKSRVVAARLATPPRRIEAFFPAEFKHHDPAPDICRPAMRLDACSKALR